MEASEFLSTVEDVLQVGRNHKLMFQNADETPLDGRLVTLDGQELLSFGSCSYLGLETDPRIIESSKRAASRWGSQFSCSRGYLSAPPYPVIEERFSKILSGHAIVTPTTTLGHLSTIPVIINEKDAILLDHQVHASVQMAATIARANGTTVELIRHGDVARLEERVEALCRTHRHVWHMIDGVFSMYGDLPDARLLKHLLERHEQFHVYVDDAHGMSVDGVHGQGIHLTRMPPHPRQVVATSLAKAFATGGGVIVLPTLEMRERVRICGAPLTFGGPLQPPVLGSILGSLDIHESDEIYALQGELRERIDFFNKLLLERGLPIHEVNHTPIFFIRTGPTRLAWEVANRLRDNHGLYTNVSVYPTVPLKRSGLRLALTRHHTFEDLERLANAVAVEFPPALEKEGVTRAEIDALFETGFQTHAQRRTRRLFDIEAERARRVRPQGAAWAPPAGLEIEEATSIDALDKAEWDALVGAQGAFDSATLQTFERFFRDQKAPENNWEFHYVVVRDGGRPILMTFFTEALWKDDMLMRAEVSRRIETHRANDPYLLTSRAMTMGSPLSEGNHLYLDRTGRWRDAFKWTLERIQHRRQTTGCTTLLLRDLPGADDELDAFLLDEGLVKMPLMTAYELDVTRWDDDEGFLQTLAQRTRRRVRADTLGEESKFEVRLYKKGVREPTEAEFDTFFDMYRYVKSRKLRLNTFDLPKEVFRELWATQGWEILALHLAPEHGGREDGKPVALGTCFAGSRRYVALICGLDGIQRETSGYRQLLWQTIRRARALGIPTLEIGMDADQEKRRLGCVPIDQCAYMQLTDHYNAELLAQLAQDASLAS